MSLSLEQEFLFGLIACQTGIVPQSQIVDALNSWAMSKSRPLAAELVERGAIDEEARSILESLVRKQLAIHEGDAQKCLAALPPGLGVAFSGLQDLELQEMFLLLTAPVSRESAGQLAEESTRPFVSAPLTRFIDLRPYKQGGMGEVLTATDLELNRPVAVKRIRGKHRDEFVARQRFRLEAEITGGLEHPGIVPVYSYGQHPHDGPYYAMRFLRGQTLAQAIDDFYGVNTDAERDSPESAIAMRGLLRRFLDVCNTVAYAHYRGIVHRDLKPGNVMLGDFGETLVVDWGLAKPVEGAVGPGPDVPIDPLRPAAVDVVAPTGFGGSVGTPGFMSPEQFAGQVDLVGPASDVYGLGAILYVLLTGRGPFDLTGDQELERRQHARGVELRRELHRVELDELRYQLVRERTLRGRITPPQALNPRASKGLEAICLNAMALEWKVRPTARELATAVERWLADEPMSNWRARIDWFRGLIERHPDMTEDYLPGLALARAEYGLALAAIGRWPEAEEAARLAVQVFEACDAIGQSKSASRYELIQARFLLVRILIGAGNRAEADVVRKQGEREVEEFAVELQRGRTYQIDPKSILYKVGLEPEQIERRMHEMRSKHRRAHPEGFPTPESSRIVDKSTPSVRLVDPKQYFDSDVLDASKIGDTMAPAEVRRPGSQGLELTAKYQVTEALGMGGMAVVYLATDIDLGREVALKESRDVGGGHDARLLREARVTAQLDHPNIPAVYGVGARDSATFFTMRHVRGKNLSDAVRSGESLQRLVQAISGAARALAYAHGRGVLHLDPKPSNILLEDGFGRAMLVDWGLAKSIAPHNSESPPISVNDLSEDSGDAIVGTPAFMSPEQARGRRSELGPKSDVFVLGGSLFFALTGVPPTSGGSLSDVMKNKVERGVEFHALKTANSPAPLAEICKKAMAFLPENRYRTATEMADDLDAWLIGKRVSVDRRGPISRAWHALIQKRSTYPKPTVALIERD